MRSEEIGNNYNVKPENTKPKKKNVILGSSMRDLDGIYHKK